MKNVCEWVMWNCKVCPQCTDSDHIWCTLFQVLFISYCQWTNANSYRYLREEYLIIPQLFESSQSMKMGYTAWKCRISISTWFCTWQRPITKKSHIDSDYWIVHHHMWADRTANHETQPWTIIFAPTSEAFQFKRNTEKYTCWKLVHLIVPQNILYIHKWILISKDCTQF